MKTITIFLLILLVIPIAIAVTPTYEQDEPLEIRHAVRVNGAPSSNLVVNLTLRDPDNLVLLKNVLMNYDTEAQEHNYTILGGNFSKLGIYPYTITATDGELNSTQAFDLEITLTGDKPDTAESVGFLLVGAGSLFFFIITLIGAIRIPWSNRRSNNGLIVGMNDLKYVKLFLWFASYLILIFIAFAFAQFSRASNLTAAYSFLNAAFYFLVAFLFPIFVITFISGIINYFNDKKIKQMLGRGLRVR